MNRRPNKSHHLLARASTWSKTSGSVTQSLVGMEVVENDDGAADIGYVHVREKILQRVVVGRSVLELLVRLLSFFHIADSDFHSEHRRRWTRYPFAESSATSSSRYSGRTYIVMGLSWSKRQSSSCSSSSWCKRNAAILCRSHLPLRPSEATCESEERELEAGGLN